MEYAITTNCLTKRYKRNVAVDSVSLHVKKGEIYGFIGRNGAGKTTCMKVICGLASPTAGEVSLFGRTGAQAAECFGKIGNLIENPGIYGNMTAEQNMEAKCILMGIQREGYVQELLKFVGLGDVGRKKAKQFSLGMRQRLGIALALVGEPEILVLDEPINGLDPQGIVEVRETLLRLKTEKNMTIMISSHILEELSKLADTYGIIDNGRLLQEISREELEEKCESFIRIRLDQPQTACTILEGMGISRMRIMDEHTLCVYERLEDSAWMNTALVRGGCSISEIVVIFGQLEDYYLQLTGGAYHA